jgi:hypothetical protein
MTRDKGYHFTSFLAGNTKAIIAITWVLMHIFLLSRNGITTDGEAGKYIEEAGTLLSTHHLSSNNYWFYLTEIGLIAAGLKLKLGFYLPVVIHLALNFIATFSFYKLAKSFSNESAALAGTLLLILYYPYQEFNTFLQTESIYYSLIILFSSRLFTLKEFGARQFMQILLLFLVLCFTRPSGILFALPAFSFLYLRFFKYWRATYQTILVTGTIAIFVVSLNAVMSSGGELNFLLPLIEEHIICGVPTTSAVNSPLADANSQLSALLSYITNNPGQFMALSLKRTVAFFGLKRDYYSTSHNLVIMVIFFALYVLSLVSIKRWFKMNVAAFCYLMITVIITWVTAVLTCDDWHNRFILAIYPLFILLSLPALQRLFPSRV